MKIFDGIEWSPTIVVSEGMPHSHSNILVKDNKVDVVKKMSKINMLNSNKHMSAARPALLHGFC